MLLEWRHNLPQVDIPDEVEDENKLLQKSVVGDFQGNQTFKCNGMMLRTLWNDGAWQQR